MRYVLKTEKVINRRKNNIDTRYDFVPKQCKRHKGNESGTD